VIVLGKRYVVNHHYVVRSANGTFKKWTSIGRSIAVDRRQIAKTKVKRGYGHLGDLRTLWER